MYWRADIATAGRRVCENAEAVAANMVLMPSSSGDRSFFVVGSIRAGSGKREEANE